MVATNHIETVTVIEEYLDESIEGVIDLTGCGESNLLRYIADILFINEF